MGYHDNNMIDEDRLIALLSDAVQRVKTEEDPLVLNQYKKIFKKNVPFSLRMYVAALLTKNVASGASFSKGRRDYDRNRSRDRVRSNDAPARRQSFNSDDLDDKQKKHNEIDEALAATIFVSVGRNRKVFHRDLIRLLVQNGGLERERIGEIRVLDNYSFVQVFAEDADKVIAVLNGLSYRGRPLQVSYSRKKEESESFNDEENQTESSEESIATSVTETIE